MQPQTRNNGAIAQLVEQRTENPCVPGSIPGGTTKNPDSQESQDFLFSPDTQKKRQNITIRGKAKSGDRRRGKNLHQTKIFLTDLQYFSHQKNVANKIDNLYRQTN